MVEILIKNDFSFVFNEIALHPIDSPLPFSMLSMLHCPIDFAATTTLQWERERKKEKEKMSDTQQSSLISSVSTLFAWDCSPPLHCSSKTMKTAINSIGQAPLTT